MNVKPLRTIGMILAVGGSLLAQGNLKWETNLAAAQKRAKAEHKLIFMDVWTEWCSWCIKLQNDTFPTPEAQAALAKMVPLSVKTQLRRGEPTENKFIEEQFKVAAYPMLIILDADGKEVTRQSGYLPAKPFAAWINHVAAGGK